MDLIMLIDGCFPYNAWLVCALSFLDNQSSHHKYVCKEVFDLCAHDISRLFSKDSGGFTTFASGKLSNPITEISSGIFNRK